MFTFIEEQLNFYGVMIFCWRKVTDGMEPTKKSKHANEIELMKDIAEGFEVTKCLDFFNQELGLTMSHEFHWFFGSVGWFVSGKYEW